MSKEYRAPAVPFAALTGTGIVFRSLTGPLCARRPSSWSPARPLPEPRSVKIPVAISNSVSTSTHFRTMTSPPVASRERVDSQPTMSPASLQQGPSDRTALRGQVGRSPGGKGGERLDRDRRWSMRSDAPEAYDLRTDRIHDARVDRADGCDDEEDGGGGVGVGID